MSTVAPAAPSAAAERVRVHAKFFFRGDRKFFLKGVTYGPFHPDAAGEFVGTPDKVRADLALMRDLGVNLLRVYHVPPRWFMDLLAEAGLFALISIPWAEHVEFLNDRAIRAQVVRTVREAVGTHRGHPAVFGYLVGNEIPTTMVRWLGVRRVTRVPRTPHQRRPRRRPGSAVFLRELPAHGVPPAAERRFLHVQRLPAQPARLRKLPPAPPEPRRRQAVHHGRVRHGHDPPHRGGATGRHALLARRERRALRPGRDGALRVDRRMVHRRHGHHRLGIRPRDPRAGAQARLPRDEGKMGRGRRRTRHAPGPATVLPEGECHRLFVQRRANPRSLPRIVAEDRLSRLRDRARGRRLDRPHAGDRRTIPSRTQTCPGAAEKHGLVLCAQRRRPHGHGRNPCLHRRRLHGRSRLALLSRRHAAQRSLRRASAGRTSRHPPRTGCRRVSPPRRGDPVMYC